MLTITDWRELSACRDSEPNLFFPIGTTGPAVDQIESAKAICTECSVREECLSYALETNQEAGVWGGTPRMNDVACASAGWPNAAAAPADPTHHTGVRPRRAPCRARIRPA